MEQERPIYLPDGVSLETQIESWRERGVLGEVIGHRVAFDVIPTEMMPYLQREVQLKPETCDDTTETDTSG